jgi:PAS domain S-box-containing protein
MNAAPIHILLVEDSAGDARLILEALADEASLQIVVKHVERLSQALKVLAEAAIDVILLDLSLPDTQGESTADQMYSAFPDIPIVILTGFNDEEFALRLVGRRAQDYLVKGRVDGPTLVRSMRYAIGRKRILVELSLSEARYRTIVEDQTELICRFLPDGTLTFANEAFARYVNKPSDALLGQNFVSLFSGKDLEALTRSIRSLNPQMPTSTVEYQLNSFSGDIRWQQWMNRAVFNDDGYFTEFQVVGRDVTLLIETQEALRQSEEKFRSIVETTGEWIWTANRASQLLYSNRAVEKMLGYSVEEIVAQDLLLCLHPEDVCRFEAFWTEQLLSRQGWNGMVVRRQHQDGAYRDLESSAVPILSPSGEVTGFRGTDRDITERKQIEAQQLKFELERDRTRLFKRFVGGVSHDLRTPLTGIGTSLDLLYRVTTDETQLRHLNKIEVQSRHMLSIVEDLFTLLRLDADTVEVSLVPLNFNQIIESVCAQQVATSDSPPIQLQLDANGREVLGDAVQLKYVVKHLLLNAANYTSDAREIGVTTFQNEQQVVLKVTDQGIGIEADELPLIFERFYRADKARSTETGGSGLGLTIIKKIVDRHSGKIWVNSLIGQGSTFFVALPLIAGGQT